MPHARFAVPTASAALAAAVLLLTPAGPAAHAAPEPELVSPSWQLDFEYDEPDAIAVKTLTGETRWYWYMTYEVTNHTGEERLFVPDITIADDTGRIIPAGEDVPARAFRAIRDELGSTRLQSQTQIVGQILQGEDHSRRGVAIWPADTDRDVDAIRIFIAGLSGETATAVDPVTGEEVLLRRTLMLAYEMPGNNTSPQDQPFIRSAEREVMR